jgi:CTP synthase (UTP-ammonia lyase)
MKISVILETDSEQIQRKIQENLNLAQQSECKLKAAHAYWDNETGKWFPKWYMVSKYSSDVAYYQSVIKALNETREILKEQLEIIDEGK